MFRFFLPQVGPAPQRGGRAAVARTELRLCAQLLISAHYGGRLVLRLQPLLSHACATGSCNRVRAPEQGSALLCLMSPAAPLQSSHAPRRPSPSVPRHAPPPLQIWARYPFMEQMTRASDSILMRLPKMNYGLGMFQKPVNMAGMTDLLATMNNTSVMNKTAMAAAISAAPQALATVANEQAQATVTVRAAGTHPGGRAGGLAGSRGWQRAHDAAPLDFVRPGRGCDSAHRCWAPLNSPDCPAACGLHPLSAASKLTNSSQLPHSPTFSRPPRNAPPTSAYPPSQYFNKNGELVTRALGNVGTNKTLAVHQALQIAIPSAANAFD